MKFQPKPSTIPADFPSWASWKSHEVYLPASFHTLPSFNKNFALAKKAFHEDSIFDGGKIDGPLLLLGLMYREAGRVQEMEPPEGDGKAPDYLVSSPLGVPQMEKLTRLINQLKLPS